MWVAELKVWHEGSTHLELSKDYDVEVYCYYLNAFTKAGETYLSRALYVTGPDAQEFIKVFGKEKRVRIEGVAGNQIFYTIRASSQYHSLLCGRRAFFLKPSRVARGFEYWVIGAWSKAAITDLVKRINASRKPRATAELLGMGSRDVNLFTPQALASLSERRAYCLALAMENGYYDYPRARNAKEIADLAGMPRTTFQEHLQKAEAKVIGEVAGQLKGYPRQLRNRSIGAL